jgi:mxaJ protein
MPLLACLLCFALPGAEARAVSTLRVCADPGNLPYSDDRERGFENRIAQLVARELGASVRYTWRAQRRGFLRSTLNADRCDVVIGVPVGMPGVRSTRPYYRSNFAFVSRKDRHLDELHSLDDPRLRALKIGVPLAGDDGSNPAPAHALARRGVSGLVGYSLWGDYRRDVPAAVDAVLSGAIDVALLWGPVAGAGAGKSSSALRVDLVKEERDGGVPLAFSIAMAVRPDDAALAERLNDVLSRQRFAIERILKHAGVPMLPLSTP